MLQEPLAVDKEDIERRCSAEGCLVFRLPSC